MTIKELQKGMFFTLKPIEEPKESQVWMKGDYDRADKGYICTRFDNISISKVIKSSTTVYDEFVF